jgi:hypothetical protein
MMNYDIDTAESAWSSFGYLCIFYGAFHLFSVLAMSKIDHSQV